MTAAVSLTPTGARSSEEIAAVHSGHRRQALDALRSGHPVVVSSAAGSGKSTLIVEVAARCAADGSRTGLLAFNRNAVDELAERAAFVGDACWFRTIDGLCWDAFRAAHAGWRAASPFEREDLLAHALRQCREDMPVDPANLSKVIQRLDTWRATGRRLPVSPAVLDVFSSIKEDRSCYDGLDVDRYIGEHPDAVRGLLGRAGITRILVDEVHDLRRLEVGLVTHLAQSGFGVLAVGDTEQQINGYRGADPGVIPCLAALRGSHLITRDLTFRARAELTPWLSMVRRQLFRHERGLVPVYSGGMGCSVRTYRAGDIHELRRLVVDGIAAEVLASLGRPMGRQLARVARDRLWRAELAILEHAGVNDIGIQVATNDEVEELADVLATCGLDPIVLHRAPVDPRTGRNARLLLAGLDPWSKTATSHEDRGPSWALRCLLEELRRRPAGAIEPDSGAGRAVDSVLQALRGADPGGPSAVARTAHMALDDLARHVPPDGKLGVWVADAQRLVRVVTAASDAEACGTREVIAEVDALLDLSARPTAATTRRPLAAAARFVGALGVGPLGAARRLRRWQVDVQRAGLVPLVAGEQRVVISTINAGKGLGFDAVFLGALRTGSFPYRGHDTHAERCKLWVGLTRAKQMLRVHVPAGEAIHLPAPSEKTA